MAIEKQTADTNHREQLDKLQEEHKVGAQTVLLILRYKTCIQCHVAVSKRGKKINLLRFNCGKFLTDGKRGKTCGRC